MSSINTVSNVNIQDKKSNSFRNGLLGTAAGTIAGGGIGYFPSYALGSAYGAQLLSRMREDVDVDACLALGDLSPINEWNCEHIWKYGCLKRSSDLLREAVGGEFDPSYYITYLEEKYSSLYSL